MDSQIFLGLLLTVLPVFELRGGLPIVIEYVIRNDLPILPYFFLVLLLNILIIFFIFSFFHFLHDFFMKMRWYRTSFGFALKRLQKKVRKVEVKMDKWGYYALILFVAIPFPGTGVWSGVFIAWVLGLDKMKSFAAIAIGVIIAGLIVLLFSLGLFNGVY